MTHLAPVDLATASVLDGLEFDHTAVAGPRLRELLSLYMGLLGGTYVLGGDNPATGYRAVQIAFAAGSRLEVLEPLAGSSFLDSFFRRNPAGGLHHLTFKTDDFPGALAKVEASAFTPYAVQQRQFRSELFLHPRSANGVLVQIVQEGEEIRGPAERTPLEDVLAGRGPRGNGVPSP